MRRAAPPPSFAVSRLPLPLLFLFLPGYPVIGLDVATIDGVFGRPDEVSDSSLTYYCTTCVAGDNPVELVIVDGRVRRVRFNYYVD